MVEEAATGAAGATGVAGVAGVAGGASSNCGMYWRGVGGESLPFAPPPKNKNKSN